LLEDDFAVIQGLQEGDSLSGQGGAQAQDAVIVEVLGSIDDSKELIAIGTVIILLKTDSVFIVEAVKLKHSIPGGEALGVLLARRI